MSAPTTWPVFASQVMARPFLDEIHHLLWTDPFLNRNVLDQGWHCREHAYLLGFLALTLGLRPTEVRGTAVFIQGPDSGHQRVGLEAQDHSWIEASGFGILDLSPRLESTTAPGWRPWPLVGVAGARCEGGGELQVADDRLCYERLIEAAGQEAACRRTIYWPRSRLALTPQHISMIAVLINSPLTVRLKRTSSPFIYTRAVLHLRRFMLGVGSSLQHLGQREAWDELDAVGGSDAELLHAISGWQAAADSAPNSAPAS